MTGIYTREGYGTVRAVVSQLQNRLLLQRSFIDGDKIIKPTVGWRLQVQYNSLPVYKALHFMNVNNVFLIAMPFPTGCLISSLSVKIEV